MQAKQAHLIIVVLALVVFMCSGCEASRFIDNMTPGSEDIANIISPDGNKDLDAEIQREKDAYGVEADAAKQYYDEKSGQMVNETQYMAYNWTDNLKKYGFPIALFFFAMGFLMRRLIKNSASLRKLGMVFEVGVPLVYILLTYVMSAVADRL